MSETAVQVLPPTVLSTIQELRSARRTETLTTRLQSNDPSFTHMKLTRRIAVIFDDFNQFLIALKANKTVKVVELRWRFLSMLDEPSRVELMKCIGGLPALNKLYIEAIGPCNALTEALSNATNLSGLWVGSLRVSSNRDVQNLAEVIRTNRSLYQVSISNLKIPVRGRHRVDEEGMVWFQENEQDETNEKLDLNPLMEALSSVPTLKKLQMELQINPEKMTRLSERSIRLLCQQPRAYLMVNACALDDGHCAALSEELESSRSVLEDLMISQNLGITSNGWELLATMTESNYYLTGLYTPSNPALAPSPYVRAKMDFYLRLNRAGRKKLLSDPSTSFSDWIDFIDENDSDISIVYYVLQMALDIFVN